MYQDYEVIGECCECGAEIYYGRDCYNISDDLVCEEKKCQASFATQHCTKTQLANLFKKHMAEFLVKHAGNDAVAIGTCTECECDIYRNTDHYNVYDELICNNEACHAIMAIEFCDEYEISEMFREEYSHCFVLPDCFEWDKWDEDY